MDYPSCLYGGDHAGEAFAVRNDRGVTIAGLCPEHKRTRWDREPMSAYHLRTWPELAERKDGNHAHQHRDADMGGDRATVGSPADARASSEKTGVHRGLPGDRQESGAHDSGPDTQSALPVRGGPALSAHPGQAVDLGASRYPEDITDRRLESHPPTRQGALEEATAPAGATQPPRAIRTAGTASELRETPLIWWQGAGELVLEPWQIELLREPFPPTLFEKNFEGEWYLPWVFCWQRILDVFVPSIPQMVPITAPQIIGDAVCIHYVLLVNGQFAGEAWGEGQRRGGNRKMTYGNACESAKSEAIRRIGKTLGINLELWEPETIRALEARVTHG